MVPQDGNKYPYHNQSLYRPFQLETIFPSFIELFNIIDFFPSQPLAATKGKYSKMRSLNKLTSVGVSYAKPGKQT